MELSDDRNPHLVWEDLPPGTRSLVLVCHHADAPGSHAIADREDRRIPVELPRRPFCHWVLVDLDPADEQIREGGFCEGVTPGGKGDVYGPHGTRRGRNDDTLRFVDDPRMRDGYLGYDGPFPPWTTRSPTPARSPSTPSTWSGVPSRSRSARRRACAPSGAT